MISLKRPDRDTGDLHSIELSVGGERVQINLKQALDLVAQQIDPHRGNCGREQVDDAATDGEVTRRIDRLDALIAGVGEPLGQLVCFEPIASLDYPDHLSKCVGLRHPLHQGVDGGDDHPGRISLDEPAKEHQPLGHDFQADRCFARQQLHGREFRGADAQGFELIDRLIRLIEVPHDQEDRPAHVPPQRRHQHNRARSTNPPRGDGSTGFEQGRQSVHARIICNGVNPGHGRGPQHHARTRHPADRFIGGWSRSPYSLPDLIADPPTAQLRASNRLAMVARASRPCDSFAAVAASCDFRFVHPHGFQ